ncbi:MAG: hypothetical protein LBC86_09610 [Oscillospiraceae bacterium]|jgi:hypothetical protein|nr:hypothetical protein [Oscillospiraceae bacterium]
MAKKSKKVLPLKQNVHVFNAFEYHLEDLDCKYCLHKKNCDKTACEFDDIRQEAIADGRIKRERPLYDSRDYAPVS